MQSESAITWLPAYSVGNPVLDKQHQRLLSLCNEALVCISSNSLESRAIFHNILNDLVNYTELHFRTEEHLLAQCNYPLLETHKAEHVAYQVRLTDFLLEATLGTLDKTGLHHYLSTWWYDHILGTDKRYADTLKNTAQDGAGESRLFSFG